MQIGLDEYILVGNLPYTNWYGTEERFTLNNKAEQAISICFYRNAVVCRTEKQYYREITATLIKELYNMENKNVCDNIRMLCRNGKYRHLFKEEMKDWYIELALSSLSAVEKV